jgi:hypothetical protein
MRIETTRRSDPSRALRTAILRYDPAPSSLITHCSEPAPLTKARRHLPFHFRCRSWCLCGTGSRYQGEELQMSTVLGGLAEFERSLIALRTSDGRERAKKAGVRFGPKPKLTHHQIEEVRRRKELGESCRFLARSYGVSPNTISRVK